MTEFNCGTFLLARAGCRRRRAVDRSGVLQLVGLATLDGGERKLAEGSGVLVIVTLYGGNDGLSTVIPYTDNAYYDARHLLEGASNPLASQLNVVAK